MTGRGDDFPFDPFPATWRRLVIAFAVATGSFALPQQFPLEFYPLNNPSSGLHYLEITCAGNALDQVQVFFDTGRGVNEFDSVRWPMGASEQAYTYTFPLSDAPIREMRIDPLSKGGSLTIRQMRIIDRSGTQILRFTKDQFIPLHQIAAISSVADGWKIVAATSADDPYARIDLYSPLVPRGMNHRNLLRSIYSWSYLGMMLWILLLAVLFTFHRPRGWRDLLSHVSFMAAIALMFSAVGNRGLIKNSYHYSRFVPPAIKPGLQLEIDLRIDHPAYAQLFWDTGQGFNENESLHRDYEVHTYLQTLRFPLPATPLKDLRFDPLDGEAQVDIREIRVVDAGNRTRAIVPLESLRFHQDILSHTLRRDTMETLEVKTQPGRKDPIILFSPETISQINQLRQEQASGR